MTTQELVRQAQEKRYADFDKSTKDVLAHKVAEKLAEKGYFSRLDQAKGITEGENPFAKKDKDKDKDKDKEEDSEDSEDSENEDKKEKKNPFAKK